MTTEHATVDAVPAGERSLAETLRAARDAYRAEIRLARGGVQAAEAYSTLIDGLLVRIHEEAAAQTDTPVALVAIGGYGRRHLCLHSDIDLLILFGGPIAAAEERFVKAQLHPLWDLGLDVGHQVRHVGELETPETDNPEFLVAVLDARFLTGDAGVFERFDTLVHGPASVWRQPTIEALCGLVADRHSQFNTTIYQLEPDVKEAPGALRDVAAIRALVALSQPGAARTVPTSSGRLDEAIDEAEEFFLRIRSLLHLENGRNLNALNHEHQEAVAERFGSPGTQAQSQVEALMSVYFHHARIIARVLANAIKEAHPPSSPEPTKPVSDNLRRDRDGISIIDMVRASLQPHTWVRAFQAAIDECCPVSPETLAFVERHGDRYTSEEFFPTTAERDQFLRLLKPTPGLYDRLSEMHENGLLGRMFPEFRKVYCRVIRDFYHKYTVDEHTLLTIRNLSALADPNSTERGRFASIFAELRQPELIVLALLFHDTGKWTDKNHAEESVRMVGGPLRRLRVPPEDIRTVEFLIRHHLQMSVAAFRRDSEDPEVAQQFARLVGTEDRLKMLCLLTLVDIQAVSPETLTPWKEELLWRLYVDTYNHITLGYGDEVIATGQSSISGLQAHRPPEISEHQVTDFLEGLPQRYLRLVDPLTVYDHIRLSRDLEPDEVRLTLDQHDDVWELSVVTKDRPRIFSNVCGVLSYFGMDILRGQAMSNRQKVVLDLFRFVDADRFLALNESGQSEVTRLLQDGVTGNADLAAMLKGREAATRARRRTIRLRSMVHFDHHYSDRYTVLEIGGANRWGLLYNVSRVISEHGCDIDLVLISTEGDRAIDVFHLTRDGAKLAPDVEQDLRTGLEAALGVADEAR
jgi:[protein-PII] uridylyltransferase|tara:strand:+ start:310 stop:2901 length:2592 start_codon:yes stop_codon:yes gene_type:complete